MYGVRWLWMEARRTKKLYRVSKCMWSKLLPTCRRERSDGTLAQDLTLKRHWCWRVGTLSMTSCSTDYYVKLISALWKVPCEQVGTQVARQQKPIHVWCPAAKLPPRWTGQVHFAAFQQCFTLCAAPGAFHDFGRCKHATTSNTDWRACSSKYERLRNMTHMLTYSKDLVSPRMSA